MTLRWVYATAMAAGAVYGGSVDRQAFPMAWDTHHVTAVDLRRHLDAPAGRDGFLRAHDGRIARPDGRRFRIWGVNICGPACFPERDGAIALADQLARMGVNCVRFHHMDSGWSVLFPKGTDHTRSLDPAALDRFDFFVSELKERGIYVNLNLNVGRRFRPGDGVRDADKLGYGKSCTYFNPRLIELQHEFARQLLTHSNPYTGAEYRHEPAVATIEIVNENSVLEGWVSGRLVGKDVEKADTWSPIPVSYAEELTDLYNRWLTKHRSAEVLAALRAETGVGDGGRVPRLAPPEFGRASPERFRAEAEFYMDIEQQFFEGMRRLLRNELDARPPVIGTADHNDGYAAYAHIEANAMFDWIDGHGYWQHPNIRAQPPTCQNTPMVNDPLDSTVTQFARTPVLGRAFTISEVNHPFPHETACEGYPILTAYALFHDWDGIYWFTWDNGRTASDGGIPPRAFFTIPPDPVKVANLIACGALWHQGGITPAKTTVVRSYTREQMIDALRIDRRERPFFTPGFDRTLPLMHATRFRFDGGPGTPFPVGAPLGNIVSDTRELSWRGADRQRGVVAVDAAGAQALIGFVRGSDALTTHIEADPANEFCSLLLVPVDGRTVRESRRLLLAATGWCGNTGMRWDEPRKALLDWGVGPAQIEPVTGSLMLRGLAAGPVRAIALTAAGARTPALLPVTTGAAGTRVTLGRPAATLVLIEIAPP